MTGKPPALCSNNFLTCHSSAMNFDRWIFYLIAASLGNCPLHPIVTAVCVIPSHLNSSHVVSDFSQSSHLISSHPISCLSLSQVFSADHNCSHLFSCHLSFHLFSAHLNSSLFSSSQLPRSAQLVATQLFLALHHSCPVRSSHLVSSQLISAFLSFEKYGFEAL